MKIAEHVYRLNSVFVNQYLIVEPDGLTLIDTGTPGNGKHVFREIEKIGEQPARLKRILITHADGDHYGALNELVKATHARVYADRVEAEAMRIGESSRSLAAKGLGAALFGLVGRFFKPKPGQVDELIEPGQVLPILNGLQVLDTAGHTPGHLSFYDPSEGVLFAGDSINIQNGKPVPSPRMLTWDQEKAARSFERQVALNPQYYCCGHGYLKAG